MSTEGRTVRWNASRECYILFLPREQHTKIKLGASVEVFSLDGRGPVYITVGAHVYGNQFKCEVPFPPPDTYTEYERALASAQQAGREMRRGFTERDNPYRQAKLRAAWLAGFLGKTVK
jgi:hypothetical protein